jgi:hypothetical protein
MMIWCLAMYCLLFLLAQRSSTLSWRAYTFHDILGTQQVVTLLLLLTVMMHMLMKVLLLLLLLLLMLILLYPSASRADAQTLGSWSHWVCLLLLLR